MKRYIKPEITTIEIETGANLMAASGGDGVKVDINGSHDSDIDRSKGHTFSVWGEDDED